VKRFRNGRDISDRNFAHGNIWSLTIDSCHPLIVARAG